MRFIKFFLPLLKQRVKAITSCRRPSDRPPGLQVASHAIDRPTFDTPLGLADLARRRPQPMRPPHPFNLQQVPVLAHRATPDRRCLLTIARYGWRCLAGQPHFFRLHYRPTGASAMIQDVVRFLCQLDLSLAEDRSQAGVARVLSPTNFLLMYSTNQCSYSFSYLACNDALNG